jgi:signal transduction histidine kinase
MNEFEQCTAARLAEVFRLCHGEIIYEWQIQATELLKDLHLDKLQLTDHLPDVIAEITRDLALGRGGDLSAEHTRGSPPAHGVQRFFDGLDIGEVVSEYNLLREAFHTVAARHGLAVVGEAAWIINHRVDEAVRLAVMSYAAQQALMRKEREEEHLAFIAHDLRTPLNAIALLVEELKYSVGGDAGTETAGLFEGIDRNMQRVEKLVARVLAANIQSSATATAFSPERREFELWPLVQRLILDLRAVASKSDIVVYNEVPRALTVFADAGLISQVFQNLLGNAFKYAAQGRVTVGAREDEGGVTCTVWDNGAGIPLDMMDKIFDKLTSDPEKEGTGLGLAIVKQIVEAHGGEVHAQSTHGAGATFCFTIPAPASPA